MESSAQAVDPLVALGSAISAAAESAGPAVVGLGRRWGAGSGVVIAPGRVLTNAHNLRGDETTVTFADDRSDSGRVLGGDPDLDLALVEVGTEDVAPVPWRPDETPAPQLGDAVLALGNPGGRGLRVTPGFVSSAGRGFRGLRGRRLRVGIEHTAPLPRGSSGGPLLDREGRLLGLNSIRLEGGLILAVACDADARRRVDALGRGEETGQRRLGVAIAPPRAARRLRRAVGLEERDGLLVRAVDEDSPAGRAGIEAGDLIVSVGGEPLDGLEPLYRALETTSGQDVLELEVVRGENERTVEVDFREGASA